MHIYVIKNTTNNPVNLGDEFGCLMPEEIVYFHSGIGELSPVLPRLQAAKENGMISFEIDSYFLANAKMNNDIESVKWKTEGF